MGNKNFALNTKVRFINVDGILENRTGIILGKSFESLSTDFYIVLLENPLPERLAITMIEHCLERV